VLNKNDNVLKNPRQSMTRTALPMFIQERRTAIIDNVPPEAMAPGPVLIRSIISGDKKTQTRIVLLI